jgi:TRAP-type transport system periplasmic protein|tara:strand:+ start:4131 stop:4619 length:489 start_codon:yes stop_codon:yes gene_type:complete
MKLRTNRNPVAQETFKALGVTDRHVCEIEDLKDAITDGECEGGEGVYSRMYPLDQNEVTQSVIDTKHSLFLTTMIMRNDFYKKLSPEVRAVLKAAALDAARKERETTIADGEEAKARLKAEGVNVHELTKEEIAEFKEKTKQVYDKFEPTFSPGLIDQIRNA